MVDIINMSNNTKIISQIDHVLVDKRRASYTLNERSYRGPNCDLDYFLVIAKMRQPLGRKKNVKV